MDALVLERPKREPQVKFHRRCGWEAASVGNELEERQFLRLTRQLGKRVARARKSCRALIAVSTSQNHLFRWRRSSPSPLGTSVLTMSILFVEGVGVDTRRRRSASSCAMNSWRPGVTALPCRPSVRSQSRRHRTLPQGGAAPPTPLQTGTGSWYAPATYWMPWAPLIDVLFILICRWTNYKVIPGVAG